MTIRFIRKKNTHTRVNYILLLLLPLLVSFEGIASKTQLHVNIRLGISVGPNFFSIYRNHYRITYRYVNEEQ